MPAISRQARMKTISRLFRNAPVFRILMLVLACAIPLAAHAAQPDAPPPGITPQQMELWKQMLQSGKELPPEAKELLEARPDLRERLPEDLRQKLERKGQEFEAGKKPEAEAGKKPLPPLEMPGFLPAYDWKSSVYVGGLFLNRLQDNEIKTLIHFGHEVFAPRPGGAAFLENLPATPDYIVGPGDEVIVRLWGRMEGTYRMTVDRDGKIFFPKLGTFSVAGMTFAELRSFLKGKISGSAEVSSDVSLGQMKGFRVSVMGEVQAPGWYSVSSVQTALQALSLAGGVKDIGSLRRVKIKRGGKEVGEIDLYDLLLQGDTRSDIPLRQGDAVFVPVVGKLAVITGEVRRPAIYEMKREKTLLDLVDMGGGFSPSAYKKRVTVERLEGHTTKVVLDEDA